ncbi:MAG: hypothetical protein R2810_03710 [Flavobacteriales bacterium]
MPTTLRSPTSWRASLDKVFEQLEFNLSNPGYFTEFLKGDVR